MSRSYFETFEREDEMEVTVEYTWSPGCPAHYGSMTYPGHPAEPPEVEIVKVVSASGEIKWTDAEDEKWSLWIMENHNPADYRYED